MVIRLLMVRRIIESIPRSSISNSNQCSPTVVAVVCTIMSVSVVHLKYPLLVIGKDSSYSGDAGFLSNYVNDPLSYVRRQITVNKMC